MNRPSWLMIGILVACAGGLAHATDVPIVGLKLIVVDKTVATGKAKVVFVAKDAAISKGAGTDQAQIAATLDVAYDSVAGAFVMAPGEKWLVNSTRIAKYVNTTAPTGGGTKVGIIKPGKVVKVVGKSLGDTPLDVSSAPSGAVYVAQTVVNGGDETRLCTQFTGCAHKIIAGGTGSKLICKRNSTGDAACTAAPPPVCGDGVVDAPGEQCDGAATTCLDVPTSCRPPGIAGECTCCTDGGAGTQLYGCCNPSAILIPFPDLAGACIATRCDPPFECSGVHECLPDGNCCAPIGDTCIGINLFPSLFLFPCCPGLECRGPSPSGVGCCVPDGGGCTTDSECCAQHCDAGTCAACRGGGESCASLFECCSLSCSGGTCDACAPAVANCLDNATCCSGSCTGFVCDP